MVFFNDRDQTEEPLHGDLSEEEEEDAVSADSSSHSAASQTCSQLFVEVRGHRHGHGRPVRIDLAVSHSISTLTRDVDDDASGRASSPPSMPTRSISSLHSLFNIAGPSSTYSHGGEISGRSSVLALQVPASSLPPPLTASAIVDSFQISASGAFFHSLPGRDEASPSTRESLPCMPCQPSQSSPHEAYLTSSSDENASSRSSHTCAVGQGEVVRRLSEVLQGRADESLALPPRSGESLISQWLHALDVHVVGACRADERLQPMLRWNSSCSGVDGQLLAHLSQHFKLRELGMLARCLCAPLVSLRVGKIQRQGRILYPTTSRGYLSVSMLPCSEMRLSFVGDDGEIERLAALKSIPEDAQVTLEMIDADPSGRSFMLTTASGKRFFWQSERSMAVGNGLLTEMKDYFLKRSTLSQLTGINESRLSSFICQLRNNLAAASSSAGFRPSSMSSALPPSASSAALTTTAASSSSPSSSCGVRQSPRLSPRASGFKDGVAKGLTNIRSLLFSKEKHRRRHEKLNPVSAINLSATHCGSLNLDGNPDRVCASLPSVSCSVAVCVGDKDGIGSQSCAVSLSPLSLFAPGPAYDGDSLSFPSLAANPPVLNSASLKVGGSNGINLPMPSPLPIPSSTLLNPYYCSCPLRSSALQYSFTPPFLPPASEFNNASSSTFFSMKPTTSVLSQTTISLDRVSISPIPLPVPSLVNIPMPLQTGSLSSFFSDPIVHIPVIDFQSASKGFLVSAPPPVSSAAFPAVLPSFLGNFCSGGERSINRQDTTELNVLQGSGLPASLEDECRDHADVLPFLRNNRIFSRRSTEGIEQVSESLWSTSLSSELERFPELNGPLLGMVPALLTSGSISCVVNFHQECTTGTWVSGSRGLYGRTCEPGIPLPSITNSIASIGLEIRETETNANATENDDQLKETQKEEEPSKRST